MNKFIVCILMLLFALSGHSQDSGRQNTDLNSTKELSNKSVQPVGIVMDGILKETYEIKTGKSFDPGNKAQNEEFIRSVWNKADLPDSYEFDYVLDIETRDYGSRKKNKMRMFLSRNQYMFGVEQKSGNEHYILVFDNENAVMLNYNVMTKERVTVPINSVLMSSFSRISRSQMDNDNRLKLEQTGDSKEILTYASKGYKYLSETAETNVYITDELDCKWDDAFGKMMNQLAPDFFSDNEEFYINGILMEAKAKRKGDKKKSEWKTKKIERQKKTILNSDYKSS